MSLSHIGSIIFVVVGLLFEISGVFIMARREIRNALLNLSKSTYRITRACCRNGDAQPFRPSMSHRGNSLNESRRYYTQNGSALPGVFDSRHSKHSETQDSPLSRSGAL